jgi:hypothetical protein
MSRARRGRSRSDLKALWMRLGQDAITSCRLQEAGVAVPLSWPKCRIALDKSLSRSALLNGITSDVGSLCESTSRF